MTLHFCLTFEICLLTFGYGSTLLLLMATVAAPPKICFSPIFSIMMNCSDSSQFLALAAVRAAAHAAAAVRAAAAIRVAAAVRVAARAAAAAAHTTAHAVARAAALPTRRADAAPPEGHIRDDVRHVRVVPARQPRLGMAPLRR